jgi:hypothetical protein
MGRDLGGEDGDCCSIATDPNSYCSMSRLYINVAVEDLMRME